LLLEENRGNVPDETEGIPVDAFNVLNRANYQVPNNIITSPTFGSPTAVNDPRQLQFGVRVLF
jgi:hypothetical protein